MDRWRCGICEYVYDPRFGDPSSEVAPGTSYLILPTEWACPLCGSDKEYFEPVSNSAAVKMAMQIQSGRRRPFVNV